MAKCITLTREQANAEEELRTGSSVKLQFWSIRLTMKKMFEIKCRQMFCETCSNPSRNETIFPLCIPGIMNTSMATAWKGGKNWKGFVIKLWVIYSNWGVQVKKMKMCGSKGTLRECCISAVKKEEKQLENEEKKKTALSPPTWQISSCCMHLLEAKLKCQWSISGKSSIFIRWWTVLLLSSLSRS